MSGVQWATMWRRREMGRWRDSARSTWEDTTGSKQHGSSMTWLRARPYQKDLWHEKTVFWRSNEQEECQEQEHWQG